MGAPEKRRTPKKGAAKRKTGRPRLRISAKQVERLASVGCTTPDMALILGCSEDTLERRFAGAIKEGRASARGSLLKKQYNLALAGNVTMLVWLGKQRLGQSDKQLTELTGKGGGPVEIDTAGVRLRIAEKLAGLASRATPDDASSATSARHE